jgi:hypothetical protein
MIGKGYIFLLLFAVLSDPANEKCVKSQTGNECLRCEKLGKTCHPRLPVGSSLSLTETPPVDTSHSTMSDTAFSSTRRVPRDASSGGSAVLHETPSSPNVDQDTMTGHDEQDPSEVPRDSNGNLRLKTMLSEQMGYDVKTQRAEYMKARSIAKRAAEPLFLDKPWKSYSISDRHEAVNRVFESFHSRYRRY